jgi:hypothetical protein
MDISPSYPHYIGEVVLPNVFIRRIHFPHRIHSISTATTRALPNADTVGWGGLVKQCSTNLDGLSWSINLCWYLHWNIIYHLQQ